MEITAATTRPLTRSLTEGEETRARAGVTADRRVLEADIHQRGQTVALTLVVRADTTPDTTRALGARFVRLVKTMASTEPDPEDDRGVAVGVGDYDYIVRVSSPTDGVIAVRWQGHLPHQDQLVALTPACPP